MESEQLENTANEALRAIIDNAAAAKEFILAELPEVVQQLLMWKAAESIVECLIGITGIVIPLLFVRWQFKNRVKHLKVLSGGGEPIYALNTLLLLPAGIGFSVINLVWLQIWIAPKVYLLEYAASLIK